MSKNLKLRLKEKGWDNYLFIIIPLILIIIIMIYPFIRTILYSFTKFDGFSPPEFIGLKNYFFLSKDTHFLNAIKNNFLVVLSTPIWVLVPLLLAVILFQNPGKLLKISRMTIMLPYAISMTVTGIIFRALLDFNGPLNSILRSIGLDFLAKEWLGNVKFALPVIIMTAFWKNFGQYSVIFLAGLSSLRQDLLDSAKIDGANWTQELIHVIIPQLKPIITFVTVLTVIHDFRYMFDYVYNMTMGGPGFATETIEFLLYNEGFRFFNMGYASVLGVLIFILISGFSIFQIKIMTRR